MRGHRCFWIAGFVVLVVVTAGCSREQPQSPAAPAPTAASPSAPASPEPTESPDPYAIPDDPADIDEAYVERVLEALLTSVADAVREVVRAKKVTPEAERSLAATHKGPSLKGIKTALRDVVEGDPGIAVFRVDATGTDVEIDELLSATPNCVFTLVQQDTSGLVKQEVEPFPAYYYLSRKLPGDDPEGRNPTPWMITGDEEPREDGKEFRDPC